PAASPPGAQAASSCHAWSNRYAYSDSRREIVERGSAALDTTRGRKAREHSRGAARVSVRRRGSGGIGGAERAERASTARAPGTSWPRETDQRLCPPARVEADAPAIAVVPRRPAATAVVDVGRLADQTPDLGARHA